MIFLKRFCDWFDMFRSCLALGFAAGLVLVAITSKYGYYGRVHNLPDHMVGPLAMFAGFAIIAFAGFVNYALVHGVRDWKTGLMSGYLASVPTLFIGLWFSAHMAKLAMS
jgi:hypothetical protein